MSTFKSRRDAARRGTLSTAKLLSTSALTAAGLLVFANTARADDPAPWTGFDTETGSATFETPSSTLTNITQNTSLYVGTSPNLDIPEGYHVNIDQASSNYIFAAKAAPHADPTYILGQLTADGRVIIIDRNGVFFGQNSSVDVAGIITTTGDLTIDELQNKQFGQYEITNITGGRIDLNGTVTVANAGLAAFVAPTVVNAGVINATMGKVALASGEAVTLDLYGDKLVEIAVKGKVANALVENSGAINANGGVVQISAAQAKDVVDNIINVSGIVDVSSVTQKGGKIILGGGDAGKVSVSGSLNASGATGGSVDIDGQNVELASSSNIDASANTADGDAGSIVAWADKLYSYGILSVLGKGGFVETSNREGGEIDNIVNLGEDAEYLIDPNNVCISSANNCGGGLPGATWVNTSTVQTTLNNAGANSFYTIDTQGGDNEQGDIIVNSDINTTTTNNNVTFRLRSHDDIDVKGSIINTGAHGLNLEFIAGYFDGAGTNDDNDLNISPNASHVIRTNGGSVYFVADRDVTLDDEIYTKGGAATFIAGRNFTIDDSDDLVSTIGSDAPVTILADDVDIGGYIFAGNNTITIGRSSAGTIDVGDNHSGDMRIDQDEIKKLFAGHLIIGDSTNTTNVTVDNVELFAQLKQTQDNLPTPSQGCENQSGGNPNCSSQYDLTDTNLTLRATGFVDIIDQGLTMGTGWVTVDAPELDLGARVFGKNSLAGTPFLLGDARLIGTQQLTKIDVLSNNARIQQAIDFADSTAQKLITVAPGTYTENLLVNKGKLKLDGTNATLQAASSGNALVTVTASDVNIDPFVFDGNNLVDFGIYAVDAGANGLVVDGNTFREFNAAGVFVHSYGNATGAIKNNTFEGSSTRGIYLGNLGPNYTLNVTNNDFGTAGSRLVNGIFGLGDHYGVINVTEGNTVYTTGEGILFNGWIDGGTVNIDEATINSSGSDAVRFGNDVKNGATVNIKRSSLSGTDDGIEFTGDVLGSTVTIANNSQILGTNDASISDGIDFRRTVTNSTVNISDNALIRGADDGIQVRGGIRGGTFRIGDGTGTQVITGLNGDGINLDSLFDADAGGNGIVVTNDADVFIDGNTITGTGPDNDTHNPGGNGDGVLIAGGVNGGSRVIVQNNTIHGYDDGVNIQGDVTNADAVQINSNDITAGDMGVNFQGNVTNSLVTVNGNHNITAGNNGVNFAGNVSGGFVQVSSNNDGIFANNHGIAFNGTVGGGVVMNIHDNIIRANQDGGVVGSGIYFGGNISNATVNIGDGSGLSDPSNFITVGPQGDNDTDGIYFAGNVGTGAKIKIDGNRIGYTGTPGNHGSAAPSAVNGDGIEFAGGVNGNADIDITDNHILAGGNPSGTGDGIKFSGHIADTANVLIGGSGDANFIDATGDGIEFHGITGGTVEISENTITADEDGIGFEAGSPSISGGAIVNVINNVINAAWDGVFVADDITGSDTTLNVKKNTITAGNEGVDIDNVNSSATVNVGGPGANDGNTIVAGGNGIEFDAGIDATVLVQKNRIKAGNDGINVRDEDAGHVTAIDSGANVKILDNEIGSQGSDTIGGHGINIEESVTGGSSVEIARNNIGRLGAGVNLDGIHFGGPITGGAHVDIHNNNHGIHADDHGMYFGGPIDGGAIVDINDNIIGANEDGGVIGSGIFFNGIITNATINIGDGTDPFQSGASNIIRVANPNGHAGWDTANLDGIHFDKEVGTGADINIDGNRIGYFANNVGGPLSPQPVAGDGIEFHGPVTGNADIDITDNYIKSQEDGIKFAGEIRDQANVLIGGWGFSYDGNHVYAGGNGISFLDEVKGESLVEISHNTVDADKDGVVFKDKTSSVYNFGSGTSEILIKKNSITGGWNGISFEKEAFNEGHDIEISENSLIKGETGDGIKHTGNINDAEMWILDNDHIYGNRDGVHIEGYLYNNAKILIDGNSDVDSGYDDGIDIHDYIPGGADVDITNNHVHHTGDNGIEITNVDGVYIGSNTVHDTGNNGIYIDPSDYVQVAYNTIYDTGTDGIHVDDGHHAWIWENDISDTGDDGIQVENNDYAAIWSNDIDTTGLNTDHGDGISVRNSDHALIKWNRITGAGRDGINVHGGHGVDILWNDIYGVGGNYWFDHGQQGASRDGIHVEYSDYVDIIGNEITGDLGWNWFWFGGAINQQGAGRHGVYVKGSDYADINYNHVRGEHNFWSYVWGAGEDGIHVENSDHADIKHNDIYKVGDDGIDVRDSDWADIIGNEIKITGGDGIQVRDSDHADINWNSVSFAGDDGIDVEDSNFADIFFNLVSNAHRNGIEVTDSDFLEIEYNNVWFSGHNGIFVDPSDFVEIDGNNVFFSGKDGIKVKDGKFITIKNNWVKFSGDDGIDVDGVQKLFILNNRVRYSGDDGIVVDSDKNYGYQFWPNFIKISGNDVDDSGDDGIQVSASKPVNLVLTNNTVTDSGDNGVLLIAKHKYGFGGYGQQGPAIRLVAIDEGGDGEGDGYGCGGDCGDYEGFFNSYISGNTIEDSGTHGLYVKGYGHNDVVLKDNFFIDNPTGARFESGKIDISDLDHPNHFIVHDGYNPEGFEYVTGMQFELAKSWRPDSLTIVGETLGSTIFEGFMARDVGTAYYVRFEDGAILDCFGNVIVIDGTNASFDGIVPDDFPGNVLPAGILADIENRLWDADDPDLNGRGQIFVGTAETGDVDEAKAFEEFDPFDGGVSGLNITITGLPRLFGPGGAPGISGLNFIAPAAGEEEGGTTPADVANIEPAAGSDSPSAQNANCWVDAVSAAGVGGGPVTYSYGGTFDESISAAASCGTQESF